MRSFLKAAIVAVAIVGTASLAVAQRPVTYKARLSVVPIDVTMQAIIAGSGSVTAVLTGTKLAVTGAYEGLRSPATIAQIHLGQRGVRGPAILDLKTSGGTSGTISGNLDLNAQQVADLQKSWLYVQLHSEKAPDGNLWGWLLPQENQK